MIMTTIREFESMFVFLSYLSRHSYGLHSQDFLVFALKDEFFESDSNTEEVEGDWYR